MPETRRQLHISQIMIYYINARIEQFFKYDTLYNNILILLNNVFVRIRKN